MSEMKGNEVFIQRIKCQNYKVCDELLAEHDKQIRLDTIEEVLRRADCSHTDCWDCAFADADMCKLQALYREIKSHN